MANPKKRSRGWFLLALVPVLGRAAFFSVRALSRTPAKIDPEKLARVERMDLARSVVATGKIQPTTQVEDQIQGQRHHLKLPVNVGDVVRQGQVICELDQNDLLPQTAAGAGGAGHGGRRSRARRPTTSGARWRPGPDVPFLKRDMERARQMFQEMLVPQTARDDAEKNYELAVNRQQQAQVNLGVAQAAITKAEAQVEQARAALSQSEEDLRNATIVRPSTAWCSRATAKWATPSARF
jgi:HlyD family secretion protein